MTRNRTKQIAVLLITFGIVGFVFSRWTQCGQISFDSNRWKQAGDLGSYDVRYRMITDLRIKLGSMMPISLDEVRGLLGPDDTDSLRPSRSTYYNKSVFFRATYCIGHNKCWNPLSNKRGQLYLLFDKNNELRRVQIAKK